MLNRPVIKVDFEHNYTILLTLFNKELDNAKKIYDKQMWLEKNKDDSAPISKNMPQVAGNLQWAHEIRQRVAVPIASLRQLDHQ